MGSLHCLDVGCAYISIIITDTGDTFFIDCFNIDNYDFFLPQDNKIKAVFITHQHEDHFSGLEYFIKFDYSIEYLIYSPYERRHSDSSVTIEEWDTFNEYKNYFESMGTKCFSPFRQESFDKPWWNTSGIRFEIIGPHKYIATSDKREIHDASLVIKVIWFYVETSG